ncbi:HNH endonuclease [Kocuria rosea]|uniref:HNH endonuclease n=1 Tax=Kocuria rosea TaxID=1275 RepID=UPI002541E18A|nr:HNH endonuclease [Kocuria rosea]WIG18407.1 HNH endonuclease [Kocuria rosea]
MDYYDFGWLSEEQRRKQEEWREKSKEATRRYWANITPEQREERKRKAAETRKRTLAAQARREAEEELKRERYERAARTRRRNKGYPDMSTADFKVWKKERAARSKELAFGPIVPDERHAVPGGFGLYDFEAIPPSYLYKRNAVFWLYVDMAGGPDACWPWHGDRGQDYHTGEPTDYGSAYWRRGYSGAHRVAWQLDSGFFVPPGLVIDHMCEVKWCVNPNHLLVCTQGHNTRMRSNRPPEFTRTATSTEPPWDDRWYPFGRRKYDEAGNLKPEYREDATWRDEPEEQVKIPEFGFGEGAISPPYPQRPIGGYVIEEPLIPDDEEF